MGLTTAGTRLIPDIRIRSERWNDPVPWVTALFTATFLLQRIAVPGLPISVTVPLAIGWVALATVLGLVEFNRTRLLVWLGAAGVSGLLVLVQAASLVDPFISINSWALWLAVWLPLIVQLRRRDTTIFLRFARSTANIGTGLAILSLVFIGSQLVGVRYRDWMAEALPSNLLVQGFNTSYPVSFGSSLYKSNGWIALEPSFMSFYLGVCLICALLVRARTPQFLCLAAGLLSTGAGSGLALVAVFVLMLALSRKLGRLRTYLLPTIIVLILSAFTQVGSVVIRRVGEVGQENSSASLRAVEPYLYLWPHFVIDPAGIFIGHGPGSSVSVASSSGTVGLLVPNIAKVMYDYGLLGGTLLVTLMVTTYLGGPSAAFALSLAASTLLLQGPAQPIILCSMLMVALWSPSAHWERSRVGLRRNLSDER